MTKSNLPEELNQAMNAVLDEFLERPRSIFDNKKATSIYKYQAENRFRKLKMNNTCIVRYCGNRSIENSHTIQKNGPLKELAENGHLLTPSFSEKTGKIELTKIGVNEASTFPGFCSEHEQMFFSFEQTKSFKEDGHIALQLYRTVCREIFINKTQVDRLHYYIEAYKVFRNQQIRESVMRNIPSNRREDPSLKFNNLKITSDDNMLRLTNLEIKKLKKNLNFLVKYEEEILDDLSKKKFRKLAYIAIEFDKPIPVALAGKGNFVVRTKTKDKNIDIVFNSLPVQGRTYIFLTSLRKFEKQIRWYADRFRESISIVNLIEIWMIHASDHWFIKPSIWASLNIEVQEILLTRLFDSTFNAGNHLPVTIFKELKGEIITSWEEKYHELSSEEKILLAVEKEKLQ